jgi:hypothetical protein
MVANRPTSLTSAKAGRPADRCCALHGADGRVHHVEVGKQSLVSLSDAPVGVTGEEPKSTHVAMVSCGAEWRDDR